MSRTLLLVEDNDQDEKLMLRVLRKAGLAGQVTILRDGQQALNYFAAADEHAKLAQNELPAAVFMDIGLPRVGGLEVLRLLRAAERTRILPIIMFSSSDDRQDRLASYRYGANSFVRKPLDFTEFEATVTAMGRYWLTVNQLP